MAASLSAEELGDSFAIQSYGDLAARRAPRTCTLPCMIGHSVRNNSACTPAADPPVAADASVEPGRVCGGAPGRAGPSIYAPRCGADAMLQALCCAHELAERAACRSVPSTPTWVRADPDASGPESGYNWAGPVGWHCVRPAARSRRARPHACMLVDAHVWAPGPGRRAAGSRRRLSPTCAFVFAASARSSLITH
jgi:hypothetical protein